MGRGVLGVLNRSLTTPALMVRKQSLELVHKGASFILSRSPILNCIVKVVTLSQGVMMVLSIKLKFAVLALEALWNSMLDNANPVVQELMSSENVSCSVPLSMSRSILSNDGAVVSAPGGAKI